MANHTSKLATIVPVYNDPAGIRVTLDSLRDRPAIDQLLVVDNGSTDGTRQLVQEHTADADEEKLVVESAVQSSYAARNAGIKHTNADIISFVDADMRVATDYFESALSHLNDHDLDYMGCRVDLTIDGEHTLAARYNQHTGFPIEQYVKHHRYAPTCSLIVRRKVFEDVGLFDPRLISGGDMEFGNRVAAAGYNLGYCPDAVATHSIRDSVWALYIKNVRVGRGHCQLQHYHPERYGVPPIPPRHKPLDIEIPNLSPTKRLTFIGLSVMMAVVRASGYAREVASASKTGTKVNEPPSL